MKLIISAILIVCTSVVLATITWFQLSEFNSGPTVLMFNENINELAHSKLITGLIIATLFSGIVFYISSLISRKSQKRWLYTSILSMFSFILIAYKSN